MLRINKIGTHVTGIGHKLTRYEIPGTKLVIKFNSRTRYCVIHCKGDGNIPHFKNREKLKDIRHNRCLRKILSYFYDRNYTILNDCNSN